MLMKSSAMVDNAISTDVKIDSDDGDWIQSKVEDYVAIMTQSGIPIDADVQRQIVDMIQAIKKVKVVISLAKSVLGVDPTQDLIDFLTR